MPHALFSRRLIFLTGKGGVGRTTVALALAAAAHRHGLRTLVADLEPGDIDDELPTASVPDGRPDSTPTRVAAIGVDHISIDPQAAMEEYLNAKLPGPAALLLRQNRLFGAFALATPGMRELLCIGKLWDLARLDRRGGEAPYDLVIVDGPASGHGTAMLRTPRTFADIARVGPIAAQAQRIAGALSDPAFTAVIAICTPEELPVNETLMVAETLAGGADPIPLQAVVVNGCHPDRFSPAEIATLGEHAEDPACRLGLVAARRAAAERSQCERLREGLSETPEVGVLMLPHLFRTELETTDVALLADVLLAWEGQRA